MANAGKYVDRFPIICTAGKKSSDIDDVSTLLRQYDSENLAEIFVKRSIEIEKKRQRQNLVKSVLFDEGVQQILHPPVDSFALFEKEVMEARFYKQSPLAKSISANTAPPHIYENYIAFGIKSKNQDEKLYDLILPPKKFSDVLRESQIGHDRYVFTHGDYNPSEPVRRGYVAPFNIKNCFGQTIKADTSGAQVRRAMVTCDSDYIFKNLTQDEVERRKKSEVGKAPNRNGGLCTSGSEDQSTFLGKPVKWDYLRARFLIYSLPKCEKRDDLYSAIAHFSFLRRKIKTMGNTNFLNDVRYSVKKKWCTWKEVYEVLDPVRIRLNINQAKLVAEHFKICNEEDKVNIYKLINLLDRFVPLPDLGRVEKIEETEHAKLTTYREMSTDAWRHDCSDADVPPAGAHLLPNPRLPSQFCKADLGSLPAETTAKSLISPSIPTVFGLSHRDYLVPRSKEDIRFLFSNADFKFTDEEFEECWEAAKKEWTSAGDMVSVEAFQFCFNKNMDAKKR